MRSASHKSIRSSSCPAFYRPGYRPKRRADRGGTAGSDAKAGVHDNSKHHAAEAENQHGDYSAIFYYKLRY
jgi:hypothetical protein